MSVQLLRRKFTVEQYQQMIESGIIAEGERVELIRGEIIEMAAIGRRHAAGVNRLVSLFSQIIGDRAILSPQNPVELDENSEPQPNIEIEIFFE
jgi:Uma2 family endonuclease